MGPVIYFPAESSHPAIRPSGHPNTRTHPAKKIASRGGDSAFPIHCLAFLAGGQTQRICPSCECPERVESVKQCNISGGENQFKLLKRKSLGGMLTPSSRALPLQALTRPSSSTSASAFHAVPATTALRAPLPRRSAQQVCVCVCGGGGERAHTPSAWCGPSTGCVAREWSPSRQSGPPPYSCTRGAHHRLRLTPWWTASGGMTALVCAPQALGMWQGGLLTILARLRRRLRRPLETLNPQP
jgi:hypothetical protein